MHFFIDSFLSTINLLCSLDEDLVNIIMVSLKVSMSSTVLSSFAGIPAGFIIAVNNFRGKRAVITIFNTALALPTVVIGLFVYTFISRRGIFGPLDMLYSQKAIIAGQIILIMPIIISFTISAISRLDIRYRKTAQTLGAGPLDISMIIFKEAKFGIMAAVVASFGRVISEIGISMMLGGNAKGFTRTMTTAMALEYDKGEFILAVALGIILMSISLCMNVLLNIFQGKAGD